MYSSFKPQKAKFPFFKCDSKTNLTLFLEPGVAIFEVASDFDVSIGYFDRSLLIHQKYLKACRPTTLTASLAIWQTHCRATFLCYL